AKRRRTPSSAGSVGILRILPGPGALMSLRVWPLVIALAVQQLPPPLQTPWFRKATRVVPMPGGRRLTVPAGFAVKLFADGLQFARFMALAPNGDVFLA